MHDTTGVETLVIDAGERTLGEIRDEVADRLAAGGVHPTTIQDVILAVSELVDNARRHGGDPADAAVTIRLDPRRRSAVEVEVENAGDASGLPPVDAWVLPAATASQGRGLAIVARVAESVATGGDRERTIVRARFVGPP